MFDSKTPLNCLVCNENSEFKNWKHESSASYIGKANMSYWICPNCGVLVQFTEQNKEKWISKE